MKRQRLSMISKEVPTSRKDKLKNAYAWISGRRKDDLAEGLWRIHDVVYDLSNFIERHPGGSFWLEITKGTDITEAFETHHINNVPETFLSKYRIKEADSPRNLKATFKEDGFYRTLKTKVQKQLKTLDYSPLLYSKIMSDFLFVITLNSIIMTTRHQSIYGVILSGILLAWTCIAGHNFFHQKDNFRMKYFNLGFLSYHEWRVTHAMSHHMFPNTEQDLEMTMFEPFLDYTTFHNKKFAIRFVSWLYSPLVWAGITLMTLYTRIINICSVKSRKFYWDDLIPLVIPIAMYLLATDDVVVVLKYWLLIILSSSTFYGIIGLTAAHHHPDTYHDGDQMRENLDWGVLQLDSIIDRADIQGNHFLTLTNFGDHSMHHLFPTLDHGLLPQLYPILFETIKEFSVELQSCGWFEQMIGQFVMLSSIEQHTEDMGKRVRVGKWGVYKSAYENIRIVARKLFNLFAKKN